MSVTPVPNPDDAAVQTPMVSPGRDVQRLRRNTAATAGELKEFLARMHGRSAKERLGIVATSGLFRSMISSIVVFAILISAFTAGPYFAGKLFAGGDEAENDPAAAEVAATEPGEPAPATDPAPAADPGVKTGQPGEVDLSDPNRITENLGIGEAREAPTNVNPLEGKADDLLDGLE